MIYLDVAATTKPKDKVVDAINYVLKEQWGNPSSRYSFGEKAKRILNNSRKNVANFINANQDEIIFTSGACESNSMALIGYMKCHTNTKLITTLIEHKSIINLAEDYNADFCLVNNKGFVVIEDLVNYCKKALQNNLIPLVSIQYANSEIGTIQNIKEISDIVHKYNGIIHTDATQIVANQKIDVKDINVDMLSFSGQKIGATKGVGVLYKKNDIQLKPIIYGSQENSLRGGTENVPYIYGLSVAINNIQYISNELQKYFLDKIKNNIEDCYLVGDDVHRLNNNLCICFKGINNEALLFALDAFDIYVSIGSACNSYNIEPSYVLSAINIPHDDRHSIIRFTFDGSISKNDIDIVVEKIKEIIYKLKIML